MEYPEEITLDGGTIHRQMRMDQPKVKTQYAKKQEAEADQKSLPRNLLAELQSLLHRIEAGESVDKLIKELQMRQLGTETDKKLVDSESPRYSSECMEIITTIENHLDHLSRQLSVVLLPEQKEYEGENEKPTKADKSLLLDSLNKILSTLIILNERVDI